MRIAPLVISLALVGMLSGLSARADPDSCRAAIDEFNAATSEVADSIRAYADCVSSSDGHDDCSSEFSTVQSDHDDFESAISSYESECS